MQSFTFKILRGVAGETDGSSYPNGGLRATHRAGGYLSIDPTSHIFLRGDTIFIPGELTWLLKLWAGWHTAFRATLTCIPVF